MTTCDGCGAQQGPLMKLSLGKDFFGRAYDRLSPSTDQSPKWYCEGCSMFKNLQRDFRDIRAEFEKLKKGQGSALTESAELQRAQVRLKEISTIAGTAPSASSLLPLPEVSQLLGALHDHTAAAAS